MGLIQKVTSISTLGIVNFRNEAELTTKYTKRTATRYRQKDRANGRAPTFGDNK